MVAVSLEKDSPRVLLRERPHLVETFTYEFRQPYHTAEKMPLERARAFIERVESESKALAGKAVQAAQTKLRDQGHKLTVLALLLASGKPLPSLDKILASHALIHTADGELFRAALFHAGKRARLSEFSLKERDLLAAASKVLKSAPAKLTTQLTSLGKPVGSPWSQDEKFAALAAWLALRLNNKQ